MKLKSANHKKHSIFRMFLIPLISIMLIQSLLTLGTLTVRRLFGTIQDFAVNMMSRTVENRKVIIENEMIRRASSVYGQEENLNGLLDGYLRDKNITLEQMLASSDRKQELLAALFPECIDTLQNSQTTGIFLILTGEDMKSEAAYDGFFIRDSDPLVNTANNTDLLFERGRKELSRQFNVPLDTCWSTYFQMKGKGVREADTFFYEPWQAGVEHIDAQISDLGYWSVPFILEEDAHDSHEMLTFSIPLRYQGSVYGVLGIEIASSLLYDYFPVAELNEEEQAGYLLALGKEDGSYESLVGKGVLYNSILSETKDFRLTSEREGVLYRVEGAHFGTQNIYAVIGSLKLYGSFAPYENQNWYLVGVNGERELFGMSRQLYVSLAIAILFGLLFGVLGIYYIVRHLTQPIKNLMTCINEGSAGLKNFRASNILEIDALYDVVQDLTNRQMESENILLEEKERYRLALESTNDTFFTYDFQKGLLDIVNHPTLNGTWKSGERGFLDMDHVYYEDREAVNKFYEYTSENEYVEFRLKMAGEEEFCWYGLYGKIISDAEGNKLKLVGSQRNIQEQKKQEAQRQARLMLDGATGFYAYNAGMEKLELSRAERPDGVMFYFLIDQFRKLNEDNGIVFGNMVLEEIGHTVRKYCKKYMDDRECPVLAIRFSNDEFLIWAACSRKQAERFLEELFAVLEHLFDRKILQVNIRVGAASGMGNNSNMELVRMAKLAQRQGKKIAAGHYPFYEDIPDRKKKPLPAAQGSQLVSYDFGEEVNLASLALNLFGRGADLSAQMLLLLQKIGRYYHASDVLITIIRPDFYANYLEYQWHYKASVPFENVNQYTDKEFTVFKEWLGLTQIRALTEEDSRSPILRKFLSSVPDRQGVVLQMYDNGSYMGNICILGVEPSVTENEEEGQKLIELGSVVQSQINQQRHDLASKAKSDFLSRMSHEIRTPMNGIIGMTAIALQNSQDQERMLDCLNKIQDSSKYLLGLINDILDMSKIESGRMRLEHENFDMREMLTTVKDLVQQQMDAKEIEFVQDIELKHRWFYADRLRISQVLINLLGNAVKFTPDKGKIVLTVQECEAEEGKILVFFSVKDNGIGIGKEDRQRVFRAFEQARDAGSISKQQGTGLGLSISSRLVQMMGNTIRLESEEGKGSSFSFEIPLELGQGEEMAEKEEKVSFAGFHVLVVEDNALNMEIAKYLLEDYGFLVDCAVNGAEAVERIKSTKPGTYDIILMDIMMPVMDGLDATRAIRAMDREDAKTLPIVAMSANAFDDDLRKSVECGMNGHLSKPIEVDKLCKMLKDILMP